MRIWTGLRHGWRETPYSPIFKLESMILRFCLLPVVPRAVCDWVSNRIGNRRIRRIAKV